MRAEYFVNGGVGKALGQDQARNTALTEFTIQRVESGFTQRWVGVGILVAGTVLNSVASILSVL